MQHEWCEGFALFAAAACFALFVLLLFFSLWPTLLGVAEQPVSAAHSCVAYISINTHYFPLGASLFPLRSVESGRGSWLKNPFGPRSRPAGVAWAAVFSDLGFAPPCMLTFSLFFFLPTALALRPLFFYCCWLIHTHHYLKFPKSHTPFRSQRRAISLAHQQPRY